MSAFTELKKVKSLWHPITDEDFDIDTSKPFFLLTEEGSLDIINSKEDWSGLFDDPGVIVDENGKFLERGKEYLRSVYFAYMYIDEQFYEAIKPFKRQYIEECKGEKERPYLFVKYVEGDMTALDFFDFDMDGFLSPSRLQHLTRVGQQENVFDDLSVDYVVNLKHCIETNPQTIFLESAKPSTAYVVTSGEYSDYHIDGVFSDKKKADFFADKDVERNVEEYDVDDEQMLREKQWYKVDIYIGESLEVKRTSIADLNYTACNKYFDAVKFTKTNSSRFYSFFLAAINRSKAKAIALERFHALLPIESSHFPKLRMVRIVSPYRHYKVWESLVFGYFDYKAYFRSFIQEHAQDLFLKVKDFLPIPLTQEEQDGIDWQNLSEEYCLQVMRKHGLNIEDKQDLSWDYYE